MSTVSELIDATLNRWLYGTYRTKTNVLNADVDASTDTIVCKYTPKAVGNGSLIALDDELMELIVTPQGNNLQVIRGVRGTTPDVHAAGTSIEINPRYPRLSVRAAMLDEIVAWPETLFYETSFETSPTAGTIDVSTAIAPRLVRRGLEVWRSSRNLSDDRWESVDWSRARNHRGPGTYDIYLKQPNNTLHCARTFRVVVGTDFVTDWFDDDTDLQDDVGIPRSAEDVLQLGAAWRLVTGHEAKRLYTEQQGESRDAAEVGTLDLARFGVQLMQMRDAGVAREAKRLKDRYGIGITG